MLRILCFLASFKSFLQVAVKCVDITTKQYCYYPSLINIFHITNTFFDEILHILLLFHSWESYGDSRTKKGTFLAEQTLPAPSKASKWTKPPWLFIHDLFLSPKNICFSYLNLYKQKKNLIHCMAWVTPLIKDTSRECSPLLKFTLVLRDNGGYLRGQHPKWSWICASSSPLPSKFGQKLVACNRWMRKETLTIETKIWMSQIIDLSSGSA